RGGAVAPGDRPRRDRAGAGRVGQVEGVGRALVYRRVARQGRDRHQVVDVHRDRVGRVRPVLVGGRGRDGGGVRVGVYVGDRRRVPVDRLDLPVAPVDRPGADGVLAGVVGGGQVEGVRRALVHRGRAAGGHRRGDVVDLHRQRGRGVRPVLVGGGGL